MARVRVLLNGAGGRMGRALLAVSAEQDRVLVEPLPRVADAASLPSSIGGDVLVDFSVPAGLHVAIALAAQLNLPLLSGTTGLDVTHERALDALAHHVPVLQASNFSLGLAALRRCASELAKQLDWDCEIVEAHHRMKRDAPSGTALSLVEAMQQARGQPTAWRDRCAEASAGQRREPGSLGVAVIRGGSVVGDHSVHFLGEGERIELVHRADDRQIFARGALHAALRLPGRTAGRYQLDDVLWQ